MRISYQKLVSPNSKDMAFLRYIYETNFPQDEKVPFE